MCNLYTFGTDAACMKYMYRTETYSLMLIIRYYSSVYRPYHQIQSIIFRYFTLYFFKAHAKILHSFQTLNEQYKWNKLVNWFPVWNWQHSIVNNTNSFGAQLNVFFVWHEVGNSHGYDFTAVAQMTTVYMFLFVERTALPHSVRKWLYWLVRSSTLTFQHCGHVNVRKMWFSALLFLSYWFHFLAWLD